MLFKIQILYCFLTFPKFQNFGKVLFSKILHKGVFLKAFSKLIKLVPDGGVHLPVAYLKDKAADNFLVYFFLQFNVFGV